MKTRHGFVSNSSSSSFVFSTEGISGDDMRVLVALIDSHNERTDEGYLYIGKKFVHGDMSFYYGDDICAFLKARGIYYECDC